MRTSKSKVDKAIRDELLDMAMEQLRIVQQTPVNDRDFANIITKADTTFNGVGKVVKIAALEAMQKHLGEEGDKLSNKVKLVTAD